MNEIISLDAALRMEGLPTLMLWEIIIDVFGRRTSSPPSAASRSQQLSPMMNGPQAALFGDIDYVPCTIPKSKGTGTCIIFEDNDAVIKMCIKGRSPAMRHVARTHRIDLDWLWERMRTDPGVFIKYVGTKEQIADMFTEGSFATPQWRALCDMAQVRQTPTEITDTQHPRVEELIRERS